MEHAFPIPEEMRAAIEAHLTQQQMSMTSFRHDVQRMFEEMDKDHLVTLRHLLSHIALAEDGRFAAYLEGTAATTLHVKHGVCASCGVNHEEELLKESSEQRPQDNQLSMVNESGDITPEALPDEPTHEDYLRECEKYNVEVHTVDGQVRCKGCGQIYVSLADRMVKPPGIENCEGCIQKTKWG